MKNTENTGIRVTPSDDVSKTDDRNPNSYSPINIMNDEIYYAAHPPASGLITLSFMSGKLANANPGNLDAWQMVVRPEVVRPKIVLPEVVRPEDEETASSCTIS